MADTTTGPTGKARMLKTGKTARGRNGPGTRRRLTPMHFLRIARLMTQAQLAEIAGVSQQMIARFESGKDVPEPFLRLRIACILGSAPECLWPPGEVLDRLLAS